jgi:tungstate transport system substrate-binding protein
VKPKYLFLAAALGLFAAALPAAAQTPAPGPTIVLASTTSVHDSGLLPYLLPAFTRKTGITVRVLAQGTGQALATAAHGDADLVLVHDPDAEQAFMSAGHGTTRREIAWNDFIVIGPAGDPAKVAGSRDPAAAFQAIWQAKAPFVSRGDKSGTDAKEKRLWRAAGLDPAKAEGGWYRDIGGGMGAALNAAAAMNAYTLSDRGTWLSFGNKADLRIVVEGGRDLINRYDVITLNPKEHAAAGQAPAQQLADWLASAEAQELIGNYTVGGKPLFHPEADAKP